MKLKPRRHRVGMSTTDRAFDGLIPQELRHLSPRHWTPIEVAIRATTLLCATPGARILDVGSGVGKLCAVGALSAPGHWCGVEQHAVLVDTARRLSRALGVGDRTSYVHGDAFSIEWSDFDALYLYNPFEIPLEVDAERPSADGFREQVARMQARLAALPEATRIVTFHGFGGVMPSSYDLVYQERVPVVGQDLVLWIQRSKARRAVVTS